MWRIASGWLDRSLRGRTGLKALDIGCGAGGTLRRLAHRPEIDRAFGIDPSPTALAHAEGMDVAIGSALSLAFSAESFDLICSFDVFQHLPAGGDTLAFREMSRVLRPGGIALLRTNGEGLWPDRSRADRPYRLGTLRDLAEGTGFRILALTYANALPSVATEIVGRIRSKVGAARTHGHPQGGGLQVRPPSPIRDHLMRGVAMLEAFAITRLRLRMPVGHTCMLLARKPEEAQR